MVPPMSLEDRRKQSRNIVLGAFLLLVVIWCLKFAYPQHTIIGIYQSHQATVPPPPPSPSTPKSANADVDKWKSKGAETFTELDLFNGTAANKAAVIIEPRFRTNLIPLILHFSSVLGPTWPILIYTSAESIGLFAASAALSRYLRAGIIQVKILPQTVLFTNSDSRNEFLMQPWLWDHLAPAEYVLLFRSDTMLCSNAARSVDDFFEYDLVIAPTKDGSQSKDGGGLSLRRRSTVMKILEIWGEEEGRRRGEIGSEEQWFFDKMKEMQEEQEAEGVETKARGAINLPSMEVARTFSVESIDYPHPLGVHHVHRWPEEQKTSLEQWCPEYQLCSMVDDWSL